MTAAADGRAAAAARVSAERIRAVSGLHDLRLAEEDVEGLLGGLPALLDGLAAADPGDLGFGDPATRFDPAPELGGGTA